MDLVDGALVLLVAGHLAGAGLSAVAPSQRADRAITAIGAIAGSLGALTAALHVLITGRPVDFALAGVATAAAGVVIRLDPLGALFLALVAAVGLPAAVFGLTYTAPYEGRRSLRAFGLMFNGFLLGMSLVPCAGNVFTFLFAWELMAVTSYFLVMTESEHRETRQAALWYAAMTHFGFMLLLPMFVLMAPSAGATTLADLRAGAALLSPVARNVVFVLALVAFGSKAGIVPLHVWLPRAHPAAPSHVSALMSGVMIKLGIYGLVRVTFDLLPGGPAWWGGVLLGVGSLSALLGVLYALVEHDLKRLLAYHSVENIGIILIGLGAGSILHSFGLGRLAMIGFAGALFHTLNHACFKSLLFLGAGSVIQQTHTSNMEHMGGLIKKMPLTAFAFLVGVAAIAALPPLNGFASEWLVFQSLLAATYIPRPEVAVGFPMAIGILALTSGLAAACFVKAFGVSFLAMPRSDRAADAQECHWSQRTVMVTLAGSCIVLGVAAPTVIQGLYGVLESVPGLSGGGRPSPSAQMWLAGPNGIAQVSPLLIAALLSAIVLVVYWAIRARGLSVRHADTWGCGRNGQTPRMQYTASAFAEPLRRIFAELYRPAEDLSISVHPESRYFVQSITYTAEVVPWFETVFYDPIARAVRACATHVRRLQAGSVHVYLLYIAGALLVALASAWWFR
ncbi:MAG: hydrogenase 4 subunit B [Acidobacteria bacterium]|nr:hydrogenase 4 subunit B [Acidobacteriota bacterium]